MPEISEQKKWGSDLVITEEQEQILCEAKALLAKHFNTVAICVKGENETVTFSYAGGMEEAYRLMERNIPVLNGVIFNASTNEGEQNA